MAPRGTFIVFEGPDGAGQTTQAALLAEYLQEQGRKVVLTKEPYEVGGSVSGKNIRDVLAGRAVMKPDLLQLLFVENRREHLAQVIEPALQRGAVVISDRYFFSTIAYGSLACDVAWLTELNRSFPVPDATFILVVDPETCITRIRSRGTEAELFEKADKLRRVNPVYEMLSGKFPNTHLVNGEQPIEGVFRDVRRVADALFV